METNIENLQHLLSQIIDINTNYLAAIVAKDQRILADVQRIAELETQCETYEKQWKDQVKVIDRLHRCIEGSVTIDNTEALASIARAAEVSE